MLESCHFSQIISAFPAFFAIAGLGFFEFETNFSPTPHPPFTTMSLWGVSGTLLTPLAYPHFELRVLSKHLERKHEIKEPRSPA